MSGQKFFTFEDENAHQQNQQRVGAHNKGDVAALGNGECRVFCPEVDCAACDTAQKEEKFIFQGVGAKF